MPGKRNVPTLLWVCVDCIVLEANGEMPTDPTPGEPEPLSDIPADCDLTVGMMASEHDEDCPVREQLESNSAVDTECECEHRSFSWSQCDGCGSSLGGERFALTMWTEE